MIWTVKNISEADFGCEERMPGEPLMVLVTLECEDGRMCRFEVADDWLRIQEIDEGDEWPEDIEAGDPSDEKIDRMADFMENYFDAVDELED